MRLCNRELVLLSSHNHQHLCSFAVLQTPNISLCSRIYCGTRFSWPCITLGWTPPYGLLDFVFFSCYIMRMLVMDRSPRVSSRASVCTLTCFSHASSVWAMLMAHHYIIAARVCSAMQPQCRRRLLVIFLLSYSLSFSCVSSPTKQNKKTIYTVAYTVYRRRSAPFILFPIYDGRGKVSPTCLESVFFLFRLYSLLRYL